MNIGGRKYSPLEQNILYNNSLTERIDKTINVIHSNISLLGQLINECYAPNAAIDAMKRFNYETLYCSLHNAFLNKPTVVSSAIPVPVLQRKCFEPIHVVPVPSCNSSTQAYDEQERIENDIFWSIVYEVFPEWKEKRTSIANATYFHHFLEKKNYDNQHHFRGKSSDPEFVKRMELFLETIEKRGLDWKKCMRKLKRRCCDLIRYNKVNSAKPSLVKQDSTSSCDYLSLISSIAQRDLSQMASKQAEHSEGSEDTLVEHV